MLDIANFIKSLKISWFRRLFKNLDSPWMNLFRSSLYELGNLNNKSIAHESNNKFWKTALSAIHEYLIKATVDDNYNVLNVCCGSILISQSTPYT